MTHEVAGIEGGISRDDSLRSDSVHRAQGCLLGQLVGDALGSMVEFQSAAQIARRYPDGLRILGPSEVFDTIAGQPTDDSEMALALARSLVSAGSYVEEQVAGAYADWLVSEPFDKGGTITLATKAMHAARLRHENMASAGRAAASRSSEANGALMRQSPLAIWGCWVQPAELLDRIIRVDTTLTHPNTVCQDASAALIIALAAVIREGLDGPAAHARACEWDRQHGHSPTVTTALERAALHASSFQPLDGHVLIALQNAFYQALHAPSFEEGIVATVMGGGDTDTNAAIAGALLGALYGRASIPQQWCNTVLACTPQRGLPGVKQPRPETYWPTDALELAEQLLDAGAAYQK